MAFFWHINRLWNNFTIMRNYILFFAGIFLLISVNAFSQEEWTLERCIHYAIANNLDVKQSNIQNKINKESLAQSKRDLLPSVSLRTGANNSFGRSLDYTTYQYVNTSQFYSSFNLSGGIDIFRGFVKQNTISFNKLSHLAGI